MSYRIITCIKITHISTRIPNVHHTRFVTISAQCAFCRGSCNPLRTLCGSDRSCMCVCFARSTLRTLWVSECSCLRALRICLCLVQLSAGFVRAGRSRQPTPADKSTTHKHTSSQKHQQTKQPADKNTSPQNHQCSKHQQTKTPSHKNTRRAIISRER